MSIIDHTLNKYDIVIRTYLDLSPLNVVCFVLENDNFVLENHISFVVRTTIMQVSCENLAEMCVCVCV